jgi:hypothetical protein
MRIQVRRAVSHGQMAEVLIHGDENAPTSPGLGPETGVRSLFQFRVDEMNDIESGVGQLAREGRWKLIVHEELHEAFKTGCPVIRAAYSRAA